MLLQADPNTRQVAVAHVAVVELAQAGDDGEGTVPRDVCHVVPVADLADPVKFAWWTRYFSFDGILKNADWIALVHQHFGEDLRLCAADSGADADAAAARMIMRFPHAMLLPEVLNVLLKSLWRAYQSVDASLIGRDEPPRDPFALISQSLRDQLRAHGRVRQKPAARDAAFMVAALRGDLAREDVETRERMSPEERAAHKDRVLTDDALMPVLGKSPDLGGEDHQWDENWKSEGSAGKVFRRKLDRFDDALRPYPRLVRSVSGPCALHAGTNRMFKGIMMRVEDAPALAMSAGDEPR